MKIAIFTYNKAHRKTHDLVLILLAMGYNDITLLIQPWEERKERHPLYQHRPEPFIHTNMSTFADNFNLKKEHINFYLDTLDVNHKLMLYDQILIGGAGIIPEEIVREHRIVNAHPGILPWARGLDALKWSILEGNPTGVTTHTIGFKPDTGMLIDEEFITPEFNEGFYHFAMRIYEREIVMLAESVTQVAHDKEVRDDHPLHQRMGHIDELKMMTIYNYNHILKINV